MLFVQILFFTFKFVGLKQNIYNLVKMFFSYKNSNKISKQNNKGIRGVPQGNTLGPLLYSNCKCKHK